MAKKWDYRTAIAVATTLLLWASAFAGIRAALKSYSPGHLALLRFLVASAVLAAYAILTHMHLPERRDLPGIALMGFLGITVYHLALNYGEVSVSAGSASFIVNAAPIFTAVFATAFLGERLKLWGWAGIAVSFTGVSLIALGEGEGLHFNSGAMLILVAALATSLYFILQKRLLRKYQALALTTYGIWFGTAIMLVLSPGLPAAVRSAPLPATGAIVYLGLFPAAVAYVTWAYALSRGPASKAASFLFLTPLLATTIAWFWLGEKPTWLALLGGLMALTGVILVNTHGR
ncbi:MAG: DMT family transporter [Anaerolineae bacterium]